MAWPQLHGNCSLFGRVIRRVEDVSVKTISADPGGVLELEAHQRGSVESLSVSEGELKIEVGSATEQAKAGETLHIAPIAYDPQRVAKTGLGDNGLHSQDGGDGLARPRALSGHSVFLRDSTASPVPIGTGAAWEKSPRRRCCRAAHCSPLPPSSPDW